MDRLEEEVRRAQRHNTHLSCLLVSVDEVERLASAHGAALPERALAYLGETLERQLRRFDRVGRPGEGELLVLLPGADERRAEIVARRSLGRLHAVKIELDGIRHPLRISIGIAQWHEGQDGEALLERARLAACAGRRGGAAGASGGERPARAGGEEPRRPDGGFRQASSAPEEPPGGASALERS